MWYIYEISNKINNSLEQPKISKYFIIDKMPPKPKDKYVELKADFDNHIVWWGERNKTEEEINQERITEIKEELEILDNTINRATEDLYSLTNTTPYSSVQEVITQKEELRAELQKLGV